MRGGEEWREKNREGGKDGEMDREGEEGSEREREGVRERDDDDNGRYCWPYTISTPTISCTATSI
jgi:hypothetical protein